MANLSLEELQTFSYKLALIPAGVCFLLNLFGLEIIALLLSVIIHLIILGVFFLLFKEFKSAFLKFIFAALIMCFIAEVLLLFKSAFLKFIFAALIMCFIAEVLLLFNSDHVKYDGVYWAFMAMHFARDIILSSAFAWNVFKSHINNELWVKVLPYIIVVPVFFIIQAFVFSNEDSYPLVFLFYNLSLCLSVLTAALRYSHTSDRSYVIMVLAMASFLLSEIFYFQEFYPEYADSFIQNLRTPFLQLGSCLMVSSTVDHVIHFKLTVKQRIYLPLTEKDSNVLRGRIAPSVVKNIVTVPKKPMEEPLI